MSAFLHPFARPAAHDFTTIVRGEGAAVWDDGGRRYVDALAGLWFCTVGHGRPEIADAVDRQMRTLEAFHTFERFTNPAAEAVCGTLAGLAPMADARVFLTNSGSEAVDTALKLARLTFDLRGEPDRHLVVGRRHAYHGVAYGGTSAQGLAPNQEGFGPLLPGFVTVDHEDLGAMAAVFAERGPEVAAVLAEPVMGAGGVRPPPPGYLAGLRRLCDDHGALLVLDEVICAFGRLGRWWGAERFGVVPDLVTFAKGVTSGYQPLGGVLVGPVVRAALEADEQFVLRHGFTYSGHPVACAAASANLAIIADEDLAARATHIGAHLGGALRSLRHEGLVADVRGLEGMWAVDMVPGVDVLAVRESLLDAGVIARPVGGATLAFCPPLVIGDDDLDLCIEALTTALRCACDRPEAGLRLSRPAAGPRPGPRGRRGRRPPPRW